MKLIIREYLSMLKESGELDELLPDLLMNMGILPLSKAQVGTRQFGVDLAAKGKDPVDGDVKLFLISIKSGNITRSVWDSEGNVQSVRPSLNEILDVYIPKKVTNKHQDLTKKIILCCNGDLKQEVEDNWKSYVDKNSVDEEIEFEFWGADKLSILIENYFLDEFLFPESARKNIRKTLTFIDDPDYNFSHFYEFIRDSFSRVKSKNKIIQKRVVRTLRLINLSLRITYYWSREENNLKPALLTAERTLLHTYNFLLENDLLEKRKLLDPFRKIYSSYITASRSYYLKFRPHLNVQDGLYGYGADKYDYPLRTFEVIGIISVVGLDQLYLGSVNKNQDYLDFSKIISEDLISLIENNPSSKTPLFDEHAIDIGLAILLLFYTNKQGFAKKWIDQLLSRIVYAYNVGQHYPIYTDSYDDLMDFEVGNQKPKEKLLSISSLIPLLMQWLAILDCEAKYLNHQKRITDILTDTNFQIWYPGEETDKYLYKKFAARESGSTLHSITFPKDFNEFKKSIIKANEKDDSMKDISCMVDIPSLTFIASRHFRTPLLPFHWQSFINNSNQE